MNDPSFLYVSDDPEKFSGQGKLFSAALPSDETVARILFDHVNESGRPMQVIVAIANTGNAPGRVAVAGCDAGPGPGIDGRNGMLVGHVATIGFLRARVLTNGGSIAEFALAPSQFKVINTPRTLQTATANPKRDGECTAGIYDFLALEPGTTYEVRVMACDPGRDASIWNDPLFQPAVNPQPAHRSGVFNIENAGKEKTIAFGATASFGDVHYNRVPEFDPTTDTNQYKGEYGVTKRFTCTLGTANSAFLYESTGSTGATASYIIGETLLSSHQFLPTPDPKDPSKKQKHRVAELTAPSTAVLTMADINSSLPVDLTVAADIPDVPGLGSPNPVVFEPTPPDDPAFKARAFTA